MNVLNITETREAVKHDRKSAEDVCARMNQAFARHDALFNLRNPQTDAARAANDMAQVLKAMLIENGWRLTYDGRKFSLL